MPHRQLKTGTVPERSRPLWLYLLALFAILIVMQGALRKWIFPGLSTPLYVLKDAVLLGGVGLFFLNQNFRLPPAMRKTALPLLWGGLAWIVGVQAFNINMPSVLVSILGIRSYLLYTVLLVMMPVALEYVERPRRLVNFIGLGVIVLVLLLGVYQFSMPAGHWINQYASQGSHVAKMGDSARISGTFSYIGGMDSFLTFSLGFSTSVFVAGIRWMKRWYQVLPLQTIQMVV